METRSQKESDYMYLDKPLQTFLDDLASSQPTPGGGSASALTGALAAGLACMVARLTIGKEAYADVQQEITSIAVQTEQLKTRFQELIQADIDAYGNLSSCFKMPRSTDEEKAERTQAIQSRLHEAALVPMEIVERAAELLQHCIRIAEIGNKSVLSDIATGTMLASSAATGASWMVRTNLMSMKDLDLVESLSTKLNASLDLISTYSQQVLTKIGERE